MSVPELMPALFVPHGGGPMPLLGEANHRELTAFMQSVSARLPRPDAILVITAHWEEAFATVSSSRAPGMLYDYHGFPPESYQFRYPAAGDPALAAFIADMLEKQGIKSRLDPARDFDHGTFVPLMLMYPDADIPVIQLSLMANFDPAAQLRWEKRWRLCVSRECWSWVQVCPFTTCRPSSLPTLLPGTGASDSTAG